MSSLQIWMYNWNYKVILYLAYLKTSSPEMAVMKAA